MKIIMLLIIVLLLIRCRLLKLRLLDIKQYINYGTKPRYSHDLIGKEISYKYTKATKNVVGIVDGYRDGCYTIMRTENANTKIVMKNTQLYRTTTGGSKVDLLEITIVDNTSGAIVKREYELI